MKKTLLLTFIVAAGFALCVTGAWAYQFNPLTEVESYQGSSAVSWGGDWHNVISDPQDTNFNIKGADLSGETLKIFTGWPGPSTSDLTAIAADLFLYSAGTSWAVRLYDGNQQLGDLFKNPAYDTSVDKFKGTGYIYGGAYDQTNPKPVSVWATTGLQAGKVSVIWGTGEVDVNLSDIPGFDTSHFSFLYPSATCGNSVLTGHVPVPPSLLLLGSGLVGIAFYRRRRASKS